MTHLVTAFQFALGALITGSFSAVNAGMSLVVSSIGGALIGFLLVWFKQKIIHLIEKASAQDVTGYLLIELLLPFLAYVLAEAFDVSGIIAAVAAGILQASGFRRITVFDAELSSLSHSTWTTIAFTLNVYILRNRTDTSILAGMGRRFISKRSFVSNYRIDLYYAFCD